MKSKSDIWVFSGSGGQIPSGVFSSKEKAEEWVRKHKLTGTLSRYPLDAGIYDWAISNAIFKVKKDLHKEPYFIQTFTSASQEHYHIEYGETED